MKEIQAFQCDHCKRILGTKSGAKRHENACAKNPVNRRACYNCRFAEKKTEVVSSWTPNGEIDVPVRAIFCKAKEHFIYPPRVQRSGSPYEFGEIENLPMPKECDKRKEPLEFDPFAKL